MCLAVPATIINMDDTNAIVDVMGVRKRINIQLLKEPQLGEHVLIHAGFAIKKIHVSEFVFLRNTIKEMIGEAVVKEGEDVE